jgi:hypothetical protein
VANTLKFSRQGAVGFIVWLDVIALFAVQKAKKLHTRQ